MKLKTLIESNVGGREPRAGDIVQPKGFPVPALFCGCFKGKMVLAVENLLPASGSAWDLRVIHGERATVVEEGAAPEIAESLFNRATKLPILGSKVEALGMKGHYIRPTAYGVEHCVAIEFTEDNQDRLSRLGLDRIVEVDDRFYGVLHVISESLHLINFPEPEDMQLAARIVEAPARIRTRR